MAPEQQRPALARRAVVQQVAEVEVAGAVAAIRQRQVAADRQPAAGLVMAAGPVSIGPTMAARAGGG